MQLKTHAVARAEDAKNSLMQLKTLVVTRVKDPQFQTLTIHTASGAVTLGCAGGAFGLASGIVTGAAAGIVPALFTFGLSIPAGAALGGGTGLFLGAGTGGLT